MYSSSMCCKYISASVPDTGDPIAIPFFGLKNWSLYWNKFCSIIIFRCRLNCSFTFLLVLFLSNQKIVDWIIPWFGKLTYKSLISNVSSLCFSVMCSWWNGELWTSDLLGSEVLDTPFGEFYAITFLWDVTSYVLWIG